MNLIYQDIPRFYTAIAEWGACIIYIFILKRHFRIFKTIIISTIFMVIQSLILINTDKISIYFWIPVMIIAVANMYIFINACSDENINVKIYGTACSFLISEFVASFEWLLYYYFTYLCGIHSKILEIGMIILVYLVLFWLIYIVEKYFLNRFAELYILRKEIITVILIVITVFLLSNMSYVYPDTPFSSSSFYEVFKLRTLIDCVGIIILFAFQIHIRELILASELNAINNVYKSQYNQYLNYQQNMEMINIKSHDLKHQIMGLRAEKDEDKRKIWLDNLENEINSYRISYTTGNKVLDAILDGKIAKAKMHNIEITYVINGKILDFVHVTDLCSIFGNALDNAIEAEIAEPIEDQRLIHVLVSTQKQFVFIKIENYCSHQILIKNELVSSTKADFKNHGYGLKSIRYSSEKYNGVMTVSVNKNWFVLNVIIPLPK